MQWMAEVGIGIGERIQRVIISTVEEQDEQRVPANKYKSLVRYSPDRDRDGTIG